MTSEHTIADEAKELVYGAREQAYGHPYDDFSRTAELWNALFHDKLNVLDGFTAMDVAAAMRMVKESRLQATPEHRDSLVDIVGYALAQERCWTRT